MPAANQQARMQLVSEQHRFAINANMHVCIDSISTAKLKHGADKRLWLKPMQVQLSEPLLSE